MQLYAYDPNSQLVAAHQAQQQIDYFCLECQCPVRKRSGPHRQAHFYHFRPSSECRQSGKGMAHLEAQLLLHRMLPPNEATLEQRFPEISRIADLAWQKKKIVFEIQCSATTATEVQNRNLDYRSLGYQVVWILHDKQYNKQRLSSVEHLLCRSPHYFTNINAFGEGIFYDQLVLWFKGTRLCDLPMLPVDLSQPKSLSLPFSSLKSFPFLTEQRLCWPIHFSGDLADAFASPDFLNTSIYHTLQEMSNRLMMEQPCHSPIFSRLKKAVTTPYHLLFQLLLEKACR